MEEKTIYTTKETAKYLGISPATIYRMEKKGIISSTKTPGGQRRFSKEKIEKYLLESKYFEAPQNPSIYKKQASNINETLLQINEPQEDYNAKILNKIIEGNCVAVMKQMPNDFVDLTVTSPPYDDLRDYNGYKFDFQNIAHQLYRITKKDGLVVWVVGKKIKNGNMLLTPFNQALFFQTIGFKMHDIMIYKKKNTPFMRSNAYTNGFEFMFVLAKGMVKTFNPLKVPTARAGFEMLVTNRKSDGKIKKVLAELKTEKVKDNIWEYAVGLGGTTNDKMAFKHPAVFPEKLAEDHILSWTNEGDLVFDPMCGSGTTLKMAKLNNRRYIGIDISEEYCKIAQERLQMANHIQLKMSL